MRTFTDERGDAWIADARQDETPRHHGRWYLVFRPADRAEPELPMPEVRWQTRETAERTVRTMSETELRRRLRAVRQRHGQAA